MERRFYRAILCLLLLGIVLAMAPAHPTFAADDFTHNTPNTPLVVTYAP